MTMIEAIAQAIQARINCAYTNGPEAVWTEVLNRLERELPSGSGIDSGTKIDRMSLPDCVRFEVDFHHMDECGFYDGWTEHLITVKPSFIGRVHIHVSGKDRNGVKEYLADTFHWALTAEIPYCCTYVAAKEALDAN